MSFLRFMASANGRVLRIVAGTGLIIAGALMGGGWYALVVVGLLPLLAGALDLCVFAPLFRQSVRGPRIRAALSR